MFASVAVRQRFNTDGYMFLLSAATMVLLGSDAISSTYTGKLHDFLGHNLTETVLHLFAYYGVILTLISNFIQKD